MTHTEDPREILKELRAAQMRVEDARQPFLGNLQRRLYEVEHDSEYAAFVQAVEAQRILREKYRV